jgi:hypothetical protein
MGRRRRLRRDDGDHVYGPVTSPSDIRRYNQEIRAKISRGRTRPQLTELVKQSQYFYTLTFSPAWRKKFRGDIREMRSTAQSEYETTVRVANRRARELGLTPDYGPD